MDIFRDVLFAAPETRGEPIWHIVQCEIPAEMWVQNGDSSANSRTHFKDRGYGVGVSIGPR